MSSASERLRTLRRIYSDRGEAWGGKDIASGIYAGLLLSAILAFPLIRAIVVELAEPSVVSALQSPNAAVTAGAVCGALLAVFALMGRLRGPVTLQPLFVTLLAATDLPRSVSLRRPFRTSALLTTTLVTGLGGLLAGVLFVAGTSSWVGAVMFVLASACVGLIGSVVWLAGQSSRTRTLWLPAVILLGGSALVWLSPLAAAILPWGWVGALWPGGQSSGWALAGLAIAVTVTLWCAPRLLDALDGARLMDDAER